MLRMNLLHDVLGCELRRTASTFTKCIQDYSAQANLPLSILSANRTPQAQVLARREWAV
jgi:hypothetical protein